MPEQDLVPELRSERPLYVYPRQPKSLHEAMMREVFEDIKEMRPLCNHVFVGDTCLNCSMPECLN